MEEVKSNSGNNLGIAALITGIITFVLAVIPCVGVIAIIPGIITIVLASVGMSQASRSDSPKGVLIAGLIIGIIAVLISLSQIVFFARMAGSHDKWPTDIQMFIDDAKKGVLKDIEDNNVSIKIESNGQKVEINTNAGKDDKMKQLEDLESGKKEQNDSLKKEVKPVKK
jgi:hypothetical protein